MGKIVAMSSIAKSLMCSVSVTANIVVTAWRNDQKGYLDGAVKQILAEAAYYLIIPCGALEAVARVICMLVLMALAVGVGLLANFFPELKSSVPYLQEWAIDMLGGAVLSAGTALNAVFSLISNPFNGGEVTLNITRKLDLGNYFNRVLLKP
jgi:hypothetical protein